MMFTVQLRIEGRDLPGTSCGPSPDSPGGYHNIHVGVQRRARPDELLDLQPGDSDVVAWSLDCEVQASDVKGPYVQGRPGERFIYLSWGEVSDAGEFRMFRRAKLMLGAVDADVLEAATRSGRLVGRLDLTDAKGHPLCAAVRPPTIEWAPA
jgi:hypothetical protein